VVIFELRSRAEPAGNLIIVVRVSGVANTGEFDRLDRLVVQTSQGSPTARPSVGDSGRCSRLQGLGGFQMFL
jgi:hypothetical protein